MKYSFGNEILSNYYVSNCLIEAIKAKKRDSRAHIIIRRTKSAILPHFLWSYKTDGYIYDFGTDHAIITPLLYRGYLRRRKERSEWESSI